MKFPAGLEGLPAREDPPDQEDLLGPALPGVREDRNLPWVLGWADCTLPVQGLKRRPKARYGFQLLSAVYMLPR